MRYLCHQLKSRVERLANALRRLGLQKGDRVCLYLPNCPEFVISYWAVIGAGGVVVPTSILRTDQGLLHEVSSSLSRFLVCPVGHLDPVMAVSERANLEGILATSASGSDQGQVQALLPRGAFDFDALIAAHDPILPSVEIDPLHDLCELAFTGGATGLPKGVMLSHANRYASIVQALPWFLKPLLGGIKGKTSVLISIPMFLRLHPSEQKCLLQTIHIRVNRMIAYPQAFTNLACIPYRSMTCRKHLKKTFCQLRRCRKPPDRQIPHGKQIKIVLLPLRETFLIENAWGLFYYW